MTAVLVTGTGGPAGVAVVRSLARREDLEVVAADMDGLAAGLYLLPPERRALVPPGADPDFADRVIDLCRDRGVRVLIPTVDVELEPLARRRADLERAGVVLAAPGPRTLAVALDKWELARRCAPLLRVPTTRLLDTEGIRAPWDFPVIVKPRRGAGSRGVRVVPSRAELTAIGPDTELIVQAMLPGTEYSVDILARDGDQVVAAVPRSRDRVDSGVAIAGRTVTDQELVDQAGAVARAIGLHGVANVQLRRDPAGRPALLEVNPRFSGAMPLTIAAGADMPSLAVDLALGRALPDYVPIREVAQVRYLTEIDVPLHELLPAHRDDAPLPLGPRS